MGLSARQQARYWGIAAAVFVAVLWLLGNTLLPFIIGAAIAYLLDPLADWLEAHGLSRVAATALITAFVVVIIAVVILLVVPVIWQQVEALISGAPEIVASFREFLSARFPALFDESSAVRQALAAMEGAIRESGLVMIQTVLSSSLVVFDFLLVLVLSPVVAFYLLLDWDRMLARIDAMIPREHLETVRGLTRDVDTALAGFVRGQLSVCAILGTFYAVALALIGLQFGVIVGLFAGLISFIPYVGSILGGTLSIGLALFQFWGEWGWIAAVAAVFMIGQAVEGNVLTPNLVGGKVGLHPVWLIFALAAFGALFGFAGLLIAVPVAAVIGVLARFGAERYREGPLYQGPAGGAGGEPGGKPRDAAE